MIQFWRQVVSRSILVKTEGLAFNLIFILSLLIGSCKNTESDLGLNLRSDNGEIYSAATDTLTVIAYSVKADSVKTDSLSTNILGAMNDPEFGISTAAIASQLAISQADLSFGVAPEVDSAILYIRWDKAYFYGNLNSTQYLNVFYLNEDIEDAKKYYSNHQALLGNEIGAWNGHFNLTDSVPLNEGNKIVKKAPGLRIKLYKKAGEDFAFAPSDVYKDIASFKKFLKGIVILPQKGGISPGEGGIAGADFFTGNSKLVVYYNDTLQHAFTFNNNCENFNIYDKKQTNQDLLNQFSHPKVHYNTTYVQSMGGCKTKIEIPYLLNLTNNLNNERIIINEAALILTPQNGSVNSFYSLPQRLNLFQPKTNSNQDSAIVDFLDFLNPTPGISSNYGGFYNSLSGDYTFRFTRHLQHLLDAFILTGQNFNKGFFVTIPSDKPITPTRLILNNTRLPNYKALKVRITYSKIKI